jgi:hypothetical protein
MSAYIFSPSFCAPCISASIFASIAALSLACSSALLQDPSTPLRSAFSRRFELVAVLSQAFFVLCTSASPWLRESASSRRLVFVGVRFGVLHHLVDLGSDNPSWP